MKKTYITPEISKILFPVEEVLAVSVVDPSTPGAGGVEVSPPTDIFKSSGPNKVF